MGDCTACTGGKKVKITNRPYRGVLRPACASDTSGYCYTNNKRQLLNRYEPVCLTRDAPCTSYPPYRTVCATPCNQCLCSSPCAETQCYYCPGDSDSGFLHSIRNGFQKIFAGRKRVSNKGRVYQYSTSQLKCLEQSLCMLEGESHVIDSAIKDAFNSSYQLDCNDLMYSIKNIMHQLEGIRCDLNCAYDCYDPCRDKYECELIESLLAKTNRLECLLNDIFMQLECLDHQSNSCPTPCEVNCCKPCCVRRPACKPDCRKPCCYTPVCSIKPACEINCRKPCDKGCRKPCSVKVGQCGVGCRKPCCLKPSPGANGCTKPCCTKPANCFPIPGLRNSSSVIPLGVMLVKL